MMQSNQPFFSNDWQGAMKVFGTFGTMLLVVVGVIVKWGQSAFKEKLDKAVNDIEGLGKKVDHIDKGCIEQAAKSTERGERLTRIEIRADAIAKAQGQSEASLDALERQVNGLQGSLLITMNDQLGERDEKISDLKVAAGRLDERINLYELFRESFNVNKKDQ